MTLCHVDNGQWHNTAQSIHISGNSRWICISYFAALPTRFRLKEERQLDSSSNITLETDNEEHVMTFPKAGLADSGLYVARAVNIVGDATVHFMLNVKGKFRSKFIAKLLL